MTLANLVEKEESGLVTSFEWNFDNKPLPSVYYCAFEEKPVFLDTLTGQYANAAIQTVYAFGITAMLIKTNSTPLERHARYVARIGPPTPYQQLREYAKTREDDRTLLQTAILAMFSSNKLKKRGIIMNELRATGLLPYFNNGEDDPAGAGAGAGAAGPGFPFDLPDGAGAGAGAGAAGPGFPFDLPDGIGAGAGAGARGIGCLFACI